jgi:hypothetical protein
MPTASDYVAMHWVHGPPVASVDDRHWGFSRREGESLAPAGVVLKVSSPAAVSGSGLTRWRLPIRNTVTAAAPITGTELLLEGDNGNQFPVYGLNHPAWKGNAAFIWPLATNAGYTASLLTAFNAMFPVGTTLTLKQNCTNGFNLAGACGSLPPQPRDSLAFETGFFDVNFEPRTFRLHSFQRRGTTGAAAGAAAGAGAPRSPAETSAFHTLQAGAEADGAAASRPWSALNLSVTLGDGSTYYATGLDDIVDTGQVPTYLLILLL